MRIVVDLQACQSLPHRDRGIGRYSMALVQAMLRQAGDDEIWVALNGALADTVEPLRAALGGLVDEQRIVVWESIPDTALTSPANGWRHAAAGRLREAFLAQLKPDVVHVSSLFEGYIDGTVATVGQGHPFLTAVTLYDLIPLVHGDTYLADTAVRDWYFAKLADLKQADLLLGISAHTCREAVDLLGVPPGRMVDVRAAAVPRFRPQSINPEYARRFLSRLGVSRRFLMYTGGFDYRKNMQGLVRAYALLPEPLRRTCQLVLVCHAPAGSREALLDLAQQSGLDHDELVFASAVTDAELVTLYNLCHALVFPSLHEGFGLPVLEAMACGAAVIGSEVSSIPEVIGRDDALFDPRNPAAIADKMSEVLTGPAYREALRRHGLDRAREYSWDDCARRALEAMRQAHTQRLADTPSAVVVVGSAARDKPLLAYVSPLPSERSGIADYSAELLPALSAHYNIEVITDQAEISDAWISEHLTKRHCAWFEKNAERYDRVLYHMGNSALHAHMLGMLERHPGTVVLHEVFLSGLVSHMELASKAPGYWTRSLYESHGYRALLDRAALGDLEKVMERYPCSLTVIRDAEGVIVHSQFCRDLADSWYGPDTGRDWKVVPLLRVLAAPSDRDGARSRLGLDNEEWLVCCFGVLGRFKCDREIIDGWFASNLANRSRARLIFVGGAHDPAYGHELEGLITERGMQSRIQITGWVDRQTYRDYLAAADCAVQLRRASRGEASGTVLDCMAHGVPTIVNAHGPFKELPSEALLKIQDVISTRDLAGALETIASDRELRARLADRARAFCAKELDPARIAVLYHDAIEAASDGPHRTVTTLARRIASLDVAPGPASQDLQHVAVAVGRNQRRRFGKSQLLVDVSELVRRDAKSGIQRVVKSVLGVLLRQPPAGFRVEPVFASPANRYRYARSFTAHFLGLTETMPDDEPIDTAPGDVLLGLDLALEEIPVNSPELQSMRRRGVKLYFIVYDQLPLLRPDCFPPHAYDLFNGWINAMAKFGDGLVCISRAVQEELRRHLDSLQVPRVQPLELGHFHLGSDVGSSGSSVGITPAQKELIDRLRHTPSFLVVGTIEPRKGHAQTLDAFEALWADNIPAIVVLIGKPGWMTEALVKRIRDHAENGKRLFWFERASDELLLRLYSTCSALLAPSEGEGFGLPLVEAAQHGLPILCRDLPVFREVVGEQASYFSGFDGEDLASAVREWLARHRAGRVPGFGAIAWLNWEQATHQLLNVILHGQWDGRWIPGEHYWFAACDPRNQISGGRRERGRVLFVYAEGARLQSYRLAVARGCYRLQVHGRWRNSHGTGRVELVAGPELSTIAGFDFATDAMDQERRPFSSTLEIVCDHADLAVQLTISADAHVEIHGVGLESLCTVTQRIEKVESTIADASLAPLDNSREAVFHRAART